MQRVRCAILYSRRNGHPKALGSQCDHHLPWFAGMQHGVLNKILHQNEHR